MQPLPCRVIKAYDSPYTEPWKIVVGESLTIIPKESEWPGWIWGVRSDGQARWVPGKFVKQYGSYGIALFDYDATELSVAVGEELAALDEVAGWFWCRRPSGQTGWVPKEILKVIS